MRPHTVTNGQLVQLLTALGFTRTNLNERYNLYTEPKSDMAFPLPKGDPTALARASHVDGLRIQLAYRGLMDEADFDAHFTNLVAVKA